MMCTSLLSYLEVLRYECRGHAVWLLHEFTLYCSVGGIYSSIQTGAVDDSEVSFFPNIKDSNFVASSSVHIATLDFL